LSEKRRENPTATHRRTSAGEFLAGNAGSVVLTAKQTPFSPEPTAANLCCS